MATTLKINGEQKTFDAPADMPLLWVLRDILGLTGSDARGGASGAGALGGVLAIVAKRALAGEHFMEDDAQRVEIDGGGDGLSRQLFRRSVRRGRHAGTDPRHLGRTALGIAVE